MPTSCWMRLSSTCSCLRSLRSSAPSGSSSSSTAGRLTSARASATRCCWPPESWRGLRLASAASRRARAPRPRAARTSSFGDALALEAEGDVLLDAQVREQRVALEDGVGRAAGRRQAGHVVAVEQHRALARLLEAGDHAQGGRLAAAGRAEHGEELARAGCPDPCCLTAVKSPKRFVTPLQADARCDCPPLGPGSSRPASYGRFGMTARWRNAENTRSLNSTNCTTPCSRDSPSAR